MTNRLIWTIVTLFAAFSAAKPLIAGSALQALIPLVSILAPVLFVLLHAPRQIGWRNLAVFFVLTSVISWSYESLSIATGFPFGNYHYTDTLGPKLGTVPLLIMPAYFGVCYISWMIARLLSNAGGARQVSDWTVVLVAGFVMVMWDLSMDPARATVHQAWIWHDGGAYFGVPFKNFAGWFLCVVTIFAAFTLWMTKSTPRPPMFTSRAEHGQALGLYGALFAEFAAYLFMPPSGTVADATGFVWNLADIYQSLGLVSIFTMGFVIVLGLIKLSAKDTAH